MLLEDIENYPLHSLDYLERVVNNGSKSGYTDIHKTSPETNPFSSKGFRVKKLCVAGPFIKCYGKPLKEYRFLEDKNFIFIHPDWTLSNHVQEIISMVTIEDSMWVVPTSSSRTVRIQGSYSYLKLYYPGVIGRIDRALKYPQLISGLNINDIFLEKNNHFPEVFDFMPESYGRLLVKNGMEVGFILREIPNSVKGYFLIPAFSLFSSDREYPGDALLHQILNRQVDAYSFFLNKICFPLVDIFFACAFAEGLIPEMHSQNIVFAFGKDWDIKKIILRDFESIDKDISLRQALGKKINFTEFPYKCISKTDKNYLKRHSYMFDHKLCEYLIEPLIECAALYLMADPTELQMTIKEYVNFKYHDRLSCFFPPDNCWYKYPDEEIDRTTSDRPYMSMGAAIYR